MHNKIRSASHKRTCHHQEEFADERVIEMGRVLAGLHPGRTHNRQRILFCPIGLGLHDMINAKRLYDLAREKDVGTTLRLWDEPIWF